MSCFICGSVDVVERDLPSTKEVEEDSEVQVAMQKMSQARMQRAIYVASHQQEDGQKNSRLKDRIQPSESGIRTAGCENDAILLPLPVDNNMQRDQADRNEYPVPDSFVGHASSPAFRNPLYIRVGTGKFDIKTIAVDPNSPNAIYFDTEQVRVERTALKMLFPTSTKAAIQDAEVARAAARARGDNDTTLEKMGKGAIKGGVEAVIDHLGAVMDAFAGAN